MPNGKPDENCIECKGRGEITLFTSSVVCECVNRIFSAISAERMIKNFGDGFLNNPYGKYDFNRKDYSINE